MGDEIMAYTTKCITEVKGGDMNSSLSRIALC